MKKNGKIADIGTYLINIDLLGLLPAERDKELMIGIKIPPALAVVDGIAGAINTSAIDNP